MSDVIELFGEATLDEEGTKWDAVVNRQWCPFLDRKCMKIRKSQPEISIGTCSVFYGKAKRPLVICPFRLLERRQIRDVRLGDPVQIHSYSMDRKGDRLYSLRLDSRLSTDSTGIAISLGLQAEANVDLEQIVQRLETKISQHTLFTLGSALLR